MNRRNLSLFHLDRYDLWSFGSPVDKPHLKFLLPGRRRQAEDRPRNRLELRIYRSRRTRLILEPFHLPAQVQGRISVKINVPGVSAWRRGVRLRSGASRQEEPTGHQKSAYAQANHALNDNWPVLPLTFHGLSIARRRVMWKWLRRRAPGPQTSGLVPHASRLANSLVTALERCVAGEPWMSSCQ